MNKRHVSYLVFIALISTLTFSQEVQRDLPDRPINDSKKEKIERLNQEVAPKYKVKDTGFVNGDISEENDELNKSLWVEEKFAGESRTLKCNPRFDYITFRAGTRLTDDCFNVVDNHHKELQKMLDEKYQKDAQGNDAQTQALRYQAESDIIQMKMTKGKERCAQVLGLNIQYLGARANWIYNVGVHSARNSCVQEWEKLSDKGGSCGKNQKATLEKFHNVYAKFDPIKHKNQGAQFMDFIEELSGQNNGCSGLTLKKKELACSVFVKRLKRGLVKCEEVQPNGAETRKKTVDTIIRFNYFVDSLAETIQKILIQEAHAGTMWDTFRSLSPSVSKGLVDNDQRLSPYLYDPMVRGVTYQSIIDKKKETAGTYDKIVLENYGRAKVVGDLENSLVNGLTSPTEQILQGVLDIDPNNPTALTAKNLEALNNLSSRLEKCTYGSLPDGGCKVPNMKWNEFYGEGEGNHVFTQIYDPNLSAQRASAIRELSKGTIFSDKMNNAMSALKKDNEKLKGDKNSPSISKYQKLASLSGMKLPKNSFMDASTSKWGDIKK